MMNQLDTVNVLGIVGSLRQSSRNLALMQAATDLLPDDMTLDIFTLHDIPLYNGDVEALGTPEPVLAFRHRIRTADAVLIATPEYNFSIPGVLKNALDWASRNIPDANPLDGKPIAIMGTGGRFGATRAQAHLQQILLHNDVRLLAKPQLALPYAGRQFDEHGRFTDPANNARVQKLLLALRDWTRLTAVSLPIQL